MDLPRWENPLAGDDLVTSSVLRIAQRGKQASHRIKCNRRSDGVGGFGGLRRWSKHTRMPRLEKGRMLASAGEPGDRALGSEI